MSNSSPPEPPPLKFDDGIAAFVAFNSASEALRTAKPTTNAPESIDFGFIQINFSNAKSKTRPQHAVRGRQNPKLVWSSSLTTISLSPRLSKPQAQKEKTSLASALEIADSTPTPTAPTPTPGVEFSDVTDGSWASPYIKLLKERSIVVGFPDGRFRPDRYATRAEFAAMLQKIFAKENKPSAIGFKDLSADYWASDAIKKVSKTGILKGYPAKDFRPDQPVTRAEVLVTLATALKLKTPLTPAKSLQVYLDGDQVLDYAQAKVAAAHEAGLVAGYTKEKLLVPNKPATRAELAAMLSQALELSGK